MPRHAHQLSCGENLGRVFCSCVYTSRTMWTGCDCSGCSGCSTCSTHFSTSSSTRHLEQLHARALSDLPAVFTVHNDLYIVIVAHYSLVRFPILGRLVPPPSCCFLPAPVHQTTKKLYHVHTKAVGHVSKVIYNELPLLTHSLHSCSNPLCDPCAILVRSLCDPCL